MTFCARVFVVVLLVVVLLIAPSNSLGRGVNQQVIIEPGVYFLPNACSLNGQGEQVELVEGTVQLSYSARDHLVAVDYQNVRGIGVTTGDSYAVTYRERHGGALASSTLKMVGNGVTFTERVILVRDRDPIRRVTCA